MINLTPHEVVVRPDDHPDIRFPTSGRTARVGEEIAESYSRFFRAAGDTPIPVVRKEWGSVDFDGPREGATEYLVSGIVAAAMVAQGYDMSGIFSPDTGPDSAVRDNEGRIVAVRRLIAHG